MKVAPLLFTDPWSHRLADGTIDAQMLRSVDCEIAVHMDMVSLRHHDSDQNYRPYLHLQGRIVQIQPDSELPYGITELPFSAGSEPPIDAFYEFDRPQLKELVGKGYFSTRFQVPDAISGIIWEYPTKVDFFVVAPENTEQPPLVFARIHDQRSAVHTRETIDHNLSRYFENYFQEEAAQPGTQEERAVPTYSGPIEDLFADQKFEVLEHSQPAGSISPEMDPNLAGERGEGLFNDLMNEVEEQRREEETKKSSADYDLQETEGVLRERIAPGVRQALSGTAEATAGPGPDSAPTPTDHQTWGEWPHEADDHQPGT